MKLAQLALRAGAALSLMLSTAALARDTDTGPVAGTYRAGGVDSLVMLHLDEDGTFAFRLAAGSLDQSAQGTWEERDGKVAFTSSPRPKAPVITAGAIDRDTGGPFTLRIVNAAGRDLQGIDFLLYFADGEVLPGYSDGAPWTLPEGESRTPQAITFEMPQYRLATGPLPLAAEAGTTASFVLHPNDFGVMDFTGYTASLDPEGLLLCWDDGCEQFRRIEQERSPG